MLSTHRFSTLRRAAIRTILAQRTGSAGYSAAALQSKIDAFRRDVEKHLPADGKHVVFATAWLATDNVFVALMRKHFPEALEGMGLVAIDTLHLFPETLECARLVQEKYNKQALWKLPEAVTTREEFVARYGDA